MTAPAVVSKADVSEQGETAPRVALKGLRDDHAYIRLELRSRAGGLLRSSRVEWVGVSKEGSQAPEGIDAPDGTTILPLPLNERRVRVAGFADGYEPAFIIVDGLGAKVRANPSAPGGFHATIEMVLARREDVGIGPWGNIEVDGMRTCPEDLSMILAVHPAGAPGEPRPGEWAVLIDRVASSYYVVGRVPTEFTLVARSSHTLPELAGPFAAAGEKRHDLQLDSGISVDVSLTRSGKMEIIKAALVTLEFSSEMQLPVPGMPSARSKSMTKRRATTNAEGIAAFHGVQGGSIVTIECRSESGEALAVRTIELPAEPKAQRVDISAGADHSLSVRLAGNTDAVGDRGDCRVILGVGSPTRRIGTATIANGVWTLDTDHRGDVRIWVECGEQRISEILELRVTDAGSSSISIPAVHTRDETVRWTNAPVGWICTWTQGSRVLREHVLKTREGSMSVAVEPGISLSCRLRAQDGASFWLDLSPRSGPFDVDFRAGESAPYRVVWPEGTPSLHVVQSDLDGQLVLENLAPPTGVTHLRFALPVQNGDGRSPIDLKEDRWYFVFESTCVPGLLAGIHASNSGSTSNHAFGTECAWRESSHAVAMRGEWVIESISGVDLTSIVPVEMRTAQGGTGDCASAKGSKGYGVIPRESTLAERGN